jgi:hypothetical protein
MIICSLTFPQPPLISLHISSCSSGAPLEGTAHTTAMEQVVIVVFTHADQLKLIKAAIFRDQLRYSLRNEFKEVIDVLLDNTF